MGWRHPSEFYMNSEDEIFWAEDNFLVNGINFNGMTSDQVKEAMKEYTPVSETSTNSLRCEDGTYKYCIDFNETTGLVERVAVELVLAESYN